MRLIDADELLTDPYFQDESIPERVMFIEAVNSSPTISTSWVHDVVKVQEEYQNLIDRRQLTKKAMCDLCIPFCNKYNLSDRQALSIARNEISLSEMVELLEAPHHLPSTLVKRGRWINNKDEYPECSECQYMPQYDPHIDDIYCSPYCPACGALMED